MKKIRRFFRCFLDNYFLTEAQLRHKREFEWIVREYEKSIQRTQNWSAKKVLWNRMQEIRKDPAIVGYYL